MTNATLRVTVAELQRAIARALEAAGTSATNAASVANALAAAEIDGQKGHGLSRVASYAAQVRAGKVHGQAVPVATLTRPGTLRIDAAFGFAYPAIGLAGDRLPAMAKRQGIAAAGITRSHHAGALGLVAERLAHEGCLALVFANTPSAMAAWGGRRAVFGTNPVAFAAPRAGAAPIVVDLALSEVARAKIVAAAQKGEPIPEGWAVDASGAPTTDAKAALSGTLLPAGGAKGAALALMVEILAAGLTGSNLAFEASPFLDDKGGPPGTGQLIIAIDATAMSASPAASERIETLATTIAAEAGVRLPGSQRATRRQAAARDGVEVDAKAWADVAGAR